MVKRIILSPTPKRLVEERLGTLAAAIKRGSTTPTGHKDLGSNGNITWDRGGGNRVTIRNIDQELSEAVGRIDGAITDLAETQVRLDGAEEAVDQVHSELDNLENATIPSIVDDLEAADQAAQQELTTLDGKLATLDGEVDAKPDFDDLTVGNLLAGSVATSEAVIERIWADGVAAKAIDTSRITVASGNIYRFADLTSAPSQFGGRVTQGVGKDGGPGVVVAPSSSQSGSYDAGPTEATPVEPGAQYRIGAWVKTDRDAPATGLSLYAAFYGASGNFLTIARQDGGAANGVWTWVEVTCTAPADAATMRLGFYTQSTYPGEAIWSGPYVARKVGAVLIEDGAITTPKLTVTEDMSAAIVNAMSVSTKKLVVTEEAVLQHATLLGQTVVDDINVQGKLIGTDGVFTGTVDFANVNVTGELLASKISGEYLYGNVVEGGEFVTQDADGRGIAISGTSFRGGPGLGVFDAGWDSNYEEQPGIGPQWGGVTVSGGVDGAGYRTSVLATPTQVGIGSYGPGYNPQGMEKNVARLSLTPEGIGIKAVGSDAYSYKVISIHDQGIDVGSVHGIGTEARVATSVDGASIRYQASAAQGRELRLDADGTWVIETGFEDIDLTAPFRSKWVSIPYPPGFKHPHGAPLAYYRVGKRVHWRGRFAKTDGTNFAAGSWTTLLGATEFDRPEYTTGLITPASGTAQCRVEASSGSAGITATPNQNTSWVSIDGLAYDLP